VPVNVDRQNDNNRKAKTRKGLSQTQIGQKLGVSRGYLNMVLNGRRSSKRLMRRLRPFLVHPKRKNQYA
jgi:transcriptional regulator with XRE-family HTH domain